MNFLDVIERVKSKLKEIQQEEVAQEILDLQLAGGTGGEVLISVCSKLLDLKRNRFEVYQFIEKEAKDLIEYARSIDLYPI
jgi:hypothetical protein